MPGIAQIGALPGIGTQVDALSKRLFLSIDNKAVLPGGRVIDGINSRDPSNTVDSSVLQAGLLMGKITASGFYAPSVLGLTNAAYNTAGTNTTLSVPAAVAIEIVRRIGTSGSLNLIGPPAASGTVATQAVTFSAVNTASGAITITALGANAVNASIVAPTDGSQTPKALVGKEDGIPVVDRFGASYNVAFAEPIIGGEILSAQIVNYPADASLKAWVKASLRAVGLAFVFDDDF